MKMCSLMPAIFGDVIYSMPVIKQMGGGHLVLVPKVYVREPFSPAKVARCATFFASQPYVRTVQYKTSEPNITYNLDDFRDTWLRLRRTGAHKPYNIAELQLMTFKLPLKLAQEPWLQIDPMTGVDVVFSRSHRYRNHAFPWKKVYDKYVGAGNLSVVFLGTREEANDFNREVGNVDWYPTEKLYDAARIIAGAKCFVGNQSALMAVAIGLQIPHIVQEPWQAEPNCLFRCVTPGFDDKVKLPDL